MKMLSSWPQYKHILTVAFQTQHIDALRATDVGFSWWQKMLQRVWERE